MSVYILCIMNLDYNNESILLIYSATMVTESEN